MRSEARGFTVIELLVALGILMSIAAIVANLVPPARVAFERVPAELDLEQRGRTAIDVLSNALRSAGRDVAATADLGMLSELLPTVVAGDRSGPSGAFRSLTVIAPVADGAQGVLEVDQGSPVAFMTLAANPCPSVREVCGFAPGTIAMIVGSHGIHDLFVVSAAVAGVRGLTPDRALSQAYPAGSVIVEVDQDTFRLAPQTDGSTSLIRETIAGAVQPIVDFVADLSIDAQGEDVPAGFFQPRQVDISLRMRAHTEAMRRIISDRVFRTSVRLRNAS